MKGIDSVSPALHFVPRLMSRGGAKTVHSLRVPVQGQFLAPPAPRITVLWL